MNKFYMIMMMSLLIVSSCNNEDSFVAGLERASTAQVAFWTASPTVGGEYIEIFFDNVSVGRIIYYSSSGIPECGDLETVTVTKAPGTYQWTGMGADGSTFSGSATFQEGTCGKIEIKATGTQPDNNNNNLYRIRNVWRDTNYLTVESGAVACIASPTSEAAAEWTLEAAAANTILIRNRSTGKYLSMDNTTLLSPNTSGSSQWTLEVLSAPERYRIRNVLNTDDYINVENGDVESSSILEGWLSAQWYLEPL